MCFQNICIDMPVASNEYEFFQRYSCYKCNIIKELLMFFNKRDNKNLKEVVLKNSRLVQKSACLI